MMLGLVSMERKWLLPSLIISLGSIAFCLAVILNPQASSTGSKVWQFVYGGGDESLLRWAEGSAHHSHISDPPKTSDQKYIFEVPHALEISDMPSPPRLAYLVSGSKGDSAKMERLLQAIYHPRNQYLLHLDLEASPSEREKISRYVQQDKTFQTVGNVHVISKSTLVTYMGSSMIATTLHAAAILLKGELEWDWFINLSASDYPLITQDDLLFVLSFLPRDLNFIEHTSDIGWQKIHRAKPIFIDPALYMKEKTKIFRITEERSLPSAFTLFSGSAWFALTRSFMEYTIMGWDNLPRLLLMYYTNYVSSPEGYFHTVLCNTPEFRNTTVNHDLHYIAWDVPPRQHPLILSIGNLDNMSSSGAVFARKFAEDAQVLDVIDKVYLGRMRNRFTPGGWCQGSFADGKDPCRVTGNSKVLRPGPGTKRFESLLLKLLSPAKFRANQCALRPQKP